MGADFGGFFKDYDAELFVTCFVGKLLQTDCSAKASWTCRSQTVSKRVESARQKKSAWETREVEM